MNSYRKYIAKIMLTNKILLSDGQAFENVFSLIMEKSNPNFMQVRPYGNIGDRKNDGFDKTTGEYYQVFAPLDVHNPSTITDAVSKLEGDFKGLYDYWNGTYPIKKYNFVDFAKYKPLLSIYLGKNPISCNINTFSVFSIIT